MNKYIIIIFCTTLLTLDEAKIIEGEKDLSQNMITCMLKQLFKIHETDVCFIYERNTNFNALLTSLNKTSVIFQRNHLNDKNLHKNYAFVLFIQTYKEFENIIETLHTYPSWNPRSKILVGYTENENMTDFFRVCWKYFVLNINIVTNRHIYTYFPYNGGSCGQNITSEILDSCATNITVYFPSKIPYDLSGCKIRIMPYPMVPYVINISAPREDPSKAGLEITIINELSKRINCTVFYVDCPHISWGFKTSNDTYTFMFQSLFSNEIDIIMGMTYANASHVVDFDGSFVYLIDYPVWWVPSALPVARWKNMSAIFGKNLWLAIFSMFLINGIVWWIFGRKTENSIDFNDIVLCLMASMYSLLQGSVKPPIRWKLRTIFILWLMTCVLLFTAHQSSLISILTTPMYNHQISSVEEMVNSTLSLGFYQGAAVAFEDKTNWIFKEILRKYVQCPLSLSCMNKTAFERNFAFMRNYRNAKYFIPRYYTFPNGRPMVYQLDITGAGIWIRMHSIKGLPILDRINNLLMLLQSNGLIGKWDRDTNYKIIIMESNDDHKALSKSHLQGAFYILIFGEIVSCLVLTCEVLYKICKKKYEK